jgi:hypothetical protein
MLLHNQVVSLIEPIFEESHFTRFSIRDGYITTYYFRLKEPSGSDNGGSQAALMTKEA